MTATSIAQARTFERAVAAKFARERQRRRDATEAKSFAGYRAHTRARSTGTLVVLVDGYEQGIASAHQDDLDDDRWWLICEDSGCIGFERQSDARSFLHHPEEWCPYCQGEVA